MAAKSGTKKSAPRSRAAPIAKTDNIVQLPQRMGAADGLANFMTGMGMDTGRRGGDFYSYTPLDDLMLMNMYRSDWMARKAVDIIAEDMTKEWRTWQLKPKQITDLDRAEVALDLRRKVRQAIKYGRLFGGGALILSDGRQSWRPLTVEGLQKGGLKYVVAVPRTMLDPDNNELDWDPQSDHYGEPEFYRLRLNNSSRRPSEGVRIHHSRIIRFLGNEYAQPMLEANPWSDSILQSVYEAVRDAGIAMQASAALVEEAKLDVMQMENLESHLSTQDANARLMERMRLFKLGKTTFNLALMGGKETFDSKTVQFGSLDKVMYVFLQVVSGATDIPATRFLAQSPAGMNSTGESDLRNYASLIRSKQEDMEASMRRLDELLMKSALGSIPKTWFYEWNSIWEMSPKEAAEVNKLNAEADQIYANSGMVPVLALEKAVINRMIESGAYPGLEEAILELDEDDLEVKRPEPAVPPLDPNKDPANFPPTTE
jgi:phage-related protein (TIGR01555 family)